jgi:hypothetical protein
LTHRPREKSPENSTPAARAGALDFYTIFTSFFRLFASRLRAITYALARLKPLGEIEAMDLLYIGGIIVFWALAAALAIGCDKLRRAPGGRP